MEGEQFVVGAALDDAALLQDDDAVAVAHGGEAVGDDKRRAALHQRVHASLHEGLSAGVDAAGCLVKDQDWRVGNRGTGDGQQLAFTLAEVAAVGIEYGVVAIAQTAYEAVGIDQLGGLDTLLVGGIKPAVAYVIKDRAREQMGLLQHHAQSVAQVTLADLVDADAVKGYFTVLDVIEAVDQVGDGGLTGTGAADEGNLLVRHGIDVNVKEDLLLVVVTEVHVIELDSARDLDIAQPAPETLT